MDSLRLVDAKELPSRNVEDIVGSETDSTAYSMCLLSSIVCSSYAHTLGVYVIPFDEVNFDENVTFPTAPEIKKPIGYSGEPMSIDSSQGNISKPKAPIYNKKNQPMPSVDPLQESIIQRPGEEPINLSMSAFLGATQVTKKDIELINDVIVCIRCRLKRIIRM